MNAVLNPPNESDYTVTYDVIDTDADGLFERPWNERDDDGVDLPAQDLSGITPSPGVVYHHDGSATITANGAATTAAGYYVWSQNDGEFKTIVAY